MARKQKMTVETVLQQFDEDDGIDWENSDDEEDFEDDTVLNDIDLMLITSLWHKSLTLHVRKVWRLAHMNLTPLIPVLGQPLRVSQFPVLGQPLQRVSSSQYWDNHSNEYPSSQYWDNHSTKYPSSQYWDNYYNNKQFTFFTASIY